ncbi:hypothetical protein B0A67_10810 [Flavobacterium aquidurense]|nr:hypothetical protein B0A67_10810 [Flavobacterium aquidurense]
MTTLHISQVFWCFFLSFFNLFSKTLHNQTNRINKKFILNLKFNRIEPKFEFIQINSKFA